MLTQALMLLALQALPGQTEQAIPASATRATQADSSVPLVEEVVAGHEHARLPQRSSLPALQGIGAGSKTAGTR